MVGVIKKKISIRIQASTLVEVLVAMVILLSVFAIGMLLFANLTRTSKSQRSRQVQLHMEHILWKVSRGEIVERPILIDSLAYYVEEELIFGFQDRKKVTVFVEQMEDGVIIDSLSRYNETNLTDLAEDSSMP